MPDELPNDSQAMAVSLVGPRHRVLELGCGAGHVTRRLVEAGCSVTGVEIDPAAARLAAEFTDEIHVADLDLTELVEILGGATFDRIVLGDVLEHLKDPRRMLDSLRRHLNDDGLLVASIPNVTHADVRLMLLGGRWRYQDAGLLDRTHLRFFDLKAVVDLFAEAGWRIERLERTTKDPLGSELRDLAVAASQMPGVLDAIAGSPDATTYQFVAVATVGAPRPDALERFADPAATPRGRSAASLDASSDGSTERLHGENAQLRVRVRELEEILEDAHWSKAVWQQRFRRLSAHPRRLLSRLRTPR